ncbi:MAG: hypothetical protein LBJ14_06640 [Desulfarculales bacterium]|jgi:hypothetical protein|nr:hypothetical protein [Desulfarculales bacterium]
MMTENYFIKADGTPLKLGDTPAPYELPAATASVKGGVKIGSGLSMNGEVLNNSNPTAYALPAASASVRGGIKVGGGLSISGDVLSAPYNPAGGYGPLIPNASYWQTVPTTLPVGGTWAYYALLVVSGDSTYISSAIRGVAAGGTKIISSSAYYSYGFIWRVS